MTGRIQDKFKHIPDRISGLVELAYNLWWSWHPDARMLFKMPDRASWKISIHNPVKTLHEVDRKILNDTVCDQKFLRHYDAVRARYKSDMTTNGGWFSNNISDPNMLPIAYFSAEYGLHHSLPFYARGLGFLAGDFIKECSDLKLPLVAVGFMYPGGYLKQRIKPDGWQESESEIPDRENAPISRIFESKGNRLILKVPFIDPHIYVDVWLNNPIPPLEASGTSGMKASLNGVPQLSILDGWWTEGFNGKNGWGFGGSANSEKTGM